MTGVVQGGGKPLVGIFANRPAATAVAAGTLYFATDIGTGIFLVSNGVLWKPATGSATLYSTMNLTGASVTGTLTETLLAAVSIPGGLLSANGSLRITRRDQYNNSATSKTVNIRYAAASGITGTIYQTMSGTTIASGRLLTDITNKNATNSQQGINVPAAYTNTGNAVIASAIDTTATSFINFTGTLALITDTITLLGYLVEWMEP